MPTDLHHRAILQSIAHRAMLERGLLPDFSASDLAELQSIKKDGKPPQDTVRDQRDLLWASIDNDDSLDLDQLSVAEKLSDGNTRILVAIADVDALVKQSTGLDEHAQHNTTSVYTAAQIFPMLHEELSTHLTSLSFNEDRLALVVQMDIGPDGTLIASDIYRALVHNQAKLAYNSVAAWLDEKGEMPQAIATVKGLAENLRLQDQVAQRLKEYRHTHGALSLQTIEARPVFTNDSVSGLEVEGKNRAKEMIEDFMIAANGVTARYLTDKKFSSIRRVVRAPKRWERIVEIAEEHGCKLPGEPDSKALEEFLVQQKAADPQRFPDLSLAIVKLIGAGEYVAELPGDPPPGHFGLAVKDYAHSTAPNRRFTDLVTQRLLKAAIAGQASPYPDDQLALLASHCTEQENAANKVERQVNKSAAALLLEDHIGQQFDAIVTGAAAKGTWVRLFHPPVEGRLMNGFEGMDVGHRLPVQLVSVDVEQGFIDFKKAGAPRH